MRARSVCCWRGAARGPRTPVLPSRTKTSCRSWPDEKKVPGSASRTRTLVSGASSSRSSRVARCISPTLSGLVRRVLVSVRRAMPVRESGPVSDRPPCSAAVLALRALRAPCSAAVLALRALRAAARASARGCICTGFVSAPAPAPRPARAPALSTHVAPGHWALQTSCRIS